MKRKLNLKQHMKLKLTLKDGRISCSRLGG